MRLTYAGDGGQFFTVSTPLMNVPVTTYYDLVNGNLQGYRLGHLTNPADTLGTFFLTKLSYTTVGDASYYSVTRLLSFNDGGNDKFVFSKPVVFENGVSLGGGTVSDLAGKIYVDTQDASTLLSAQTYTNTKDASARTDFAAGDISTLSAAKNYSDTREVAIRTDYASSDATTLSSAKSYTDTRETAIRADLTSGVSTTLQSAKDYVDDREVLIRSDFAAADTVVLSSSKDYTGARETAIRTDFATGDTNTLDLSKAYTDGRESVIRVDFATADATTLSSAKSYTDTREAKIRSDLTGGITSSGTSILASANLYTDSRETLIRSDFTSADTVVLSGAKSYTDTREAAIKTLITSTASSTLADAKDYTDDREVIIRSDFASSDTVIFSNSKSYIDTRETAIRTDFAAADTVTLNSAKDYTDTRETAIKKYVDDADDSLQLLVENYADDQDAKLKLYIDDHDSSAVASANSYTDGKITSVRTDFATGDTNTLTSAKDYTDTRETAIKKYVDDADDSLQLLVENYADDQDAKLKLYIDDQDSSAVASSNAYTDSKITSVRTDFATSDTNTLTSAKGYTDTRETAIRSYVDTQDAATLKAANLYTDNKAIDPTKYALSSFAVPTADVSFNSFRATNLKAGLNDNDATTVIQVNARISEAKDAIRATALNYFGKPVDNLDINNKSLTNVAYAVNSTDGANKQFVSDYVDTKIAAMNGNIALSGAVTGSGLLGSTINTTLNNNINNLTNQAFSFSQEGGVFNLQYNNYGSLRIGNLGDTKQGYQFFYTTLYPSGFPVLSFGMYNSAPNQNQSFGIWEFSDQGFQMYTDIKFSNTLYRVKNMANPIDAQDAVTKIYSDTEDTNTLNGAKGYVDARILNTVTGVAINRESTQTTVFSPNMAYGLNLFDNWSAFNTTLEIQKGDNALRLTNLTNNTVYQEFYINGSRAGWFGFGNNTTDFELSNEKAGTFRIYNSGWKVLEATSNGVGLFGRADPSGVGLSTEVLAFYIANGTVNNRYIDVKFPIYVLDNYTRNLDTNARVYNYYGDRGTGFTNGNFGLRVSAILAGEIWLSSSIKLKNKIEDTESNIEQEAINTISSLPVAKYTKIDDKNKKVQLGFIAEEVNVNHGELVDTEDKSFVPNIYDEGKVIAVDDETKEITIELDNLPTKTPEGTGITFVTSSLSKTDGELISQNGKIIVIKSDRVKLTIGDDVFVYGTFEACPSIDKTKLFEINVIATKNLINRVVELEAKNAQLESRLAAIEAILAT